MGFGEIRQHSLASRDRVSPGLGVEWGRVGGGHGRPHRMLLSLLFHPAEVWISGIAVDKSAAASNLRPGLRICSHRRQHQPVIDWAAAAVIGPRTTAICTSTEGCVPRQPFRCRLQVLTSSSLLSSWCPRPAKANNRGAIMSCNVLACSHILGARAMVRAWRYSSEDCCFRGPSPTLRRVKSRDGCDLEM